MVSDEIGAELHHRFVIGQPITKDEKILLDKWYEKMDLEEAAMLEKNAPKRMLTDDELKRLEEKVKLAEAIHGNLALLQKKNRCKNGGFKTRK